MIHPNRLCQLELHSEDPKASIAFFREVFGWPEVPISIHEYTVLQVPDDCPYGISIVAHLQQEIKPFSTGVVPYFNLDTAVSEFLAKVEEQNGRLVWGPRAMPGYGQLYCVEDPGGIRIGIYTKD